MHDAKYDVIIISGGVAGIAAAIYTARLALKTVLLTEKRGGTIILTNDIANYPGFRQITGLELIQKLEQHAKDYNIKTIEKKATKIERCSEGCLKVFTDENKHYHTRTIIIATGTEWRKLNIPGEEEFTSKGVHYCALCDGPFYKNKIVAVIGGSDSAAKEAILLAGFAKKVYIIYRSEKIRPEPINLKKVQENNKIEIINNTNILEIKGNKFVTSVTLDNPYKGKNEFNLDAIFIEIGHTPLSKLAKDTGIKINEKNEIIINKNSETNQKGIYAAGDVSDTTFKQAITGVGEAVKAAYSAYHYINTTEQICLCNDEDQKNKSTKNQK